MSLKTSLLFLLTICVTVSRICCAHSSCYNETLFKPVSASLKSIVDVADTWYYGGYTYPIPIILQCDKLRFDIDENNVTKGDAYYTATFLGIERTYEGRIMDTEVSGIEKFYDYKLLGFRLKSYTYLTILDFDSEHITAVGCGAYGFLRVEGFLDKLTNILIIWTKKKGESADKIKTWKEDAEKKNPNMKFSYPFRYQNYENCD